MPQKPQMPNIPEGVLKTAEAAAYLGVEPETLRNLRRRGRVAFLRYGPKTVRYEKTVLDRFMAESRVSSEVPAPDAMGRARKAGRAA